MHVKVTAIVKLEKNCQVNMHVKVTVLVNVEKIARLTCV